MILMADITRAATPITNRNIIQPSKESRNANEVPFDFQDTSKVKQTTQNSDMQSQNNVLRQDGSTTGFYEILHDAEISSAFLKNIFLLKEIVDILPLNNSTQTEEMQQLLDNLVLKPEEIAGEMMRQEDISTIFKGGFFDILRTLISQNTEKNQVQPDEAMQFRDAVANLLKALNNDSSKADIFKSVENNLEYLKEQVYASPKLTEELEKVITDIKDFAKMTEGLENTKGMEQTFGQLKSQMFSVFGDVEKSILYSDELAKTMSMTTYNLSRVSMSEDGVTEAFAKLLGLIENDTDKENLTHGLLKFLDDKKLASESKTMNALTEILEKQVENPQLKMLNSDSMNKIIQSLLSSPCNFTPLLHYVIPVEYENVQASAEMWINPDGQEDMAEPTDKKCTHMLIVFEIEDIGKFETELFVQDKNIDLNILCPKEYSDFYRNKLRDLRKDLSFSDYRLKNINVDKLEKPRSLIEVFKSLPLRRTGVNVTI